MDAWEALVLFVTTWFTISFFVVGIFWLKRGHMYVDATWEQLSLLVLIAVAAAGLTAGVF